MKATTIVNNLLEVEDDVDPQHYVDKLQWRFRDWLLANGFKLAQRDNVLERFQRVGTVEDAPRTLFVFNFINRVDYQGKRRKAWLCTIGGTTQTKEGNAWAVYNFVRPYSDLMIDEALDFDDPDAFMDSHPHFRFVLSQYEGYQVWIDSEHDKTLSGRGHGWPQNIGAVASGPDGRWYVVYGRGLVNDHFGFGVHERSKTFDSKESAALAIWTRQHERSGNLPNSDYAPGDLTRKVWKDRRSNKRRR